jgi:hypothetical protein
MIIVDCASREKIKKELFLLIMWKKKKEKLYFHSIYAALMKKIRIMIR